MSTETVEDLDLFEKVRQAEMIRGYRLTSLWPLARYCLACGGTVPEGSWCCIGWYYHLTTKHGWMGAAAGFAELHEKIAEHSTPNGGQCATCKSEFEGDANVV